MRQVSSRKMMARRLGPRTALILLIWTGLISIGGSIPWLRAADDDGEVLRVVWADNPRDPAGATTDILLRPNTEQKFYPFVENPTDRDRKVIVKLHGGNPATDLATSEAVTVAAGQTRLFHFGKIAAPPPGMQLPFVPVDPPPYRFGVLITDDKGMEIQKQVTYAGLLRPAQYLDIPEIRYESGMGNLSATVKTLPQFTGSPAHVELILSPRTIPGLDPGSMRASGAFGASVGKGETATLVARNLRFLTSPPDKGIVSLTADSYERAFIFETTFTKQDGDVTPLRVAGRNPRLRLSCPRYSVPDPKFPVTLELDNVTRSDVTLELGADPAGTGEYKTQEFVGDREQHVSVSPKSPDGAMVFKTEVKDWKSTIDLSMSAETLRLRGRLLDSKHKPLEVEDEREQVVMEVVQPVTIDNTPPKIPEFTEKPARLPRGTNYTFHIAAEDRESGIDLVRVFLAPAPEDEKIVPKGGERASPPPNETGNGVWTCNLTMPAEGNSTPVSIRAVNHAGLSIWSKTMSIPLVDAATAESGQKPSTGSIKVTVKNAGDIPQPKLNVVLYDEKGMEQARKETNDEGTCTFENLKPGGYKIACSKPAAGTKGEATATVEVGKPAEVTIVLGF